MRLRKRPDGRGGRGPRGRSPVRHRKGEPTPRDAGSRKDAGTRGSPDRAKSARKMTRKTSRVPYLSSRRTRARAAVRTRRSRRHPRAWRHAGAHGSNRARPRLFEPRRGADAGEPGLLVSPAELRHGGPHWAPLGRHSRGAEQNRGLAGCRVDAKESGPPGADIVLGREGAAQLRADALLGKEASVPSFSLGKEGNCRSAGCRVVLGRGGGSTLPARAIRSTPSAERQRRRRVRVLRRRTQFAAAAAVPLFGASKRRWHSG